MLAKSLPDSHQVIFLLWAASIASLLTQTNGLAISYCSPENNAGSNPGYYSQYMSNGLCQNHCQGSFAFAVIQGYNCWCSNYVPADQESTYDCNQQCPGFGSEWCGSTDAGLYGYYLLSPGVPLGTSGSSGSSTPSTSSSPSVSTSQFVSGSSSTSTSDAPETTFLPSSSFSPVVTVGSSQSSDEASSVTYTASSAALTTSSSSTSSLTPSSTSSSTYIPPTTSSDPPTTSPTPTSSPTPSPSEVYTSVTTVTGEVRTILVTPTPTTSSDATLGQSATGGGSGVSAGKVVGIVLGSAVGVGALIGAAVYVWFRRRQRRRQGTDGRPETSFIPRTGDTSPSNNIPSRQVSQLSSSGLLGNKVPRINTANMTNGSDPRSAEPGSAGFDRRSLATDQRLNPYALYIHDEGHVSNVSLQDNQDYSRQLRVANPDP
ncbi:Cell wall integrity and stress response component 4 [Exophiala xenobiotica]|uniref:Cell wall integrity and stress response component 4 n=1 Tax=Vermiconidia calcicola TaxID=1690605 RepID=A0AAV9QL16_9PEZI|nr:Cell wall integrity and stress response component 4 [Exophiala xenobiotica]KAK5343009.1 Cell wall integrity and stress response component 4 [Exophiala xenobiotica]KAK5437592.1 Cell wall integrity and stress response component 4 [Exophiala xenobiotica]KAK5545629.1 Cell wall integrity and stress response component 4 [Vermiconidia calcicola]KAK5550110.1 Cell wall integrity and stress response component 4 [Chaetothyriales sp. CCFEE 6169]